MADNIYYGTTPDREGKDRYFNTIAEVPSAGEFGEGVAQVGLLQLISNGATWASQPVTIGCSGVKVALTGTTTETVLGVIPIPDGVMGPNSMLEIAPQFNWTSSANGKIATVSIGQSAGTGTIVYRRTRTTTGDNPLIRLVNRGVLNSQVDSCGSLGTFGANNANFLSEITRAVDFALPNLNIYITGTLADTGEFIDLNSYLVTVINPYL